ARASGDRDYPSLVLHYRWRCYNQNSRKCRDTRGSILEFAMTETLLISANTLSPGHDYAFELTVTSADGRFAVAQSHVSVAAEMKSPSAALDLSLVQKAQPLQCGLDFVNIGPRAHLSVSLNGTSPQIVDWSLEWTSYNEGTTDFLGADHAEADQVVPLQVQLGSAISIMDASDLAIPSTYFFNAATEEGRRWCPVTFNLPPSGGACTATATGASDAQMPLEVVCEGFFDEHAPLTYAVGFEVAVAGQEYSYFGKPVFDNKQTVHVLSIPARIHVRITDRLGSFLSTMVVVDGATSQVQQNLDDSLIRDILRAARTEGEVQRSIINVVQNAAATV
ncbi:MAG: REJ domain-containing protein, partial [Promethearchaeia archaeon]